MATSDETIGANVRRLRELLDLSQAEVARRMTAKGWRWTQPTVAAIEKGERSLKLAEASALTAADVLDVDDMADLLGVPIEDIAWVTLGRAERASQTVQRALADLMSAIYAVASVADELEIAGKEIGADPGEFEWWINFDPAALLRGVPAELPELDEHGLALVEGDRGERRHLRMLAGAPYAEFARRSNAMLREVDAAEVERMRDGALRYKDMNAWRRAHGLPPGGEHGSATDPAQ